MHGCAGCRQVDCCANAGPWPTNQCYQCCPAQLHSACTYNTNHTIVGYRTANFSVWEPLGAAGDGVLISPADRATGTVFVPRVAHNRASGRYVMWFENYIHGGPPAGEYSIAVSSSAAGPWTLVRDRPHNSANFSCGGSQGDFDIFVDDDDRAYIVNTYYSWFCIEELAPDYLGGTGRTARVTAMDPTIKGHPDGDEAPTLFKRQGLYYLTYASGCCGCKGGSVTWQHTSRSPLGPWTSEGVLLTPNGPTTRAQQRAVFTVPAPGGELQWIHLGNAWVPGRGGEGTCTNGGLLYWWPLRFSPNGSVVPITAFEDSVSFELETADDSKTAGKALKSDDSARLSARTVHFDGRSMIVDGERVLILGGSMHPPRVPREQWSAMLAEFVELGLNSVETYVFWNYHEQEKGVVRWDGQRDLAAFIRLAQQHGLYVTLRIGPYACAEWYMGGIPLWMRDDPTVGCFRCNDVGWQREMARWSSLVMEQVRPLLWPNGGPIIMLQIENEGGSSVSGAYYRWAVDMALGLTTDVPWNICHVHEICDSLDNDTALDGKLICTINGVWQETSSRSSTHPSPGWVAQQRKANPTQPLIWTEDTSGTPRYQWGQAQTFRLPADQLYGMMRFLSIGGSWNNFYMGHGGNNFGLWAGGHRDIGGWAGEVTSYDADTPIDYLGLRNEPKFSLFAAFFKALSNPRILTEFFGSADIPSAQDLGGGAELRQYGTLAFVSCTNTTSDCLVQLPMGQRRVVGLWTVAVFSQDGDVLLNTSATLADYASASTGHVPRAMERTSRLYGSDAVWEVYVETPAAGTQTQRTSSGTIEQLLLTKNAVDYCWYTTNVTTAQLSAGHLSFVGNGIATVFVDGRLAGEATAPAGFNASQKNLTVTISLQGVGQEERYSYGQKRHELQIMVAAMAMPNGYNGRPGGKGVLDRVALGSADLTWQPWEMRWLMTGETEKIFTLAGRAAVPWTTVQQPGHSSPLSWYQAMIPMPEGAANSCAFALNLASMWKGQAWVNGFHLGRYWLRPGGCPSENDKCTTRPRMNSEACPLCSCGCSMCPRPGACDKPTQHLYRVPREVLREQNLVTVFEESARPVDPAGIRLTQVWQHPPLDRAKSDDPTFSGAYVMSGAHAVDQAGALGGVLPQPIPGVRGERISVEWADVEPAPGHFNFSRVQVLVHAALAAGRDIIFRFDTGNCLERVENPGLLGGYRCTAPRWLISAGVPVATINITGRQATHDNGNHSSYLEKWPFYFSPVYVRHFRLAHAAFRDHLFAAYSRDIQRHFVGLELCFGSTCDVGPWHGIALEPHLRIDRGVWMEYWKNQSVVVATLFSNWTSDPGRPFRLIATGVAGEQGSKDGRLNFAPAIRAVAGNRFSIVANVVCKSYQESFELDALTFANPQFNLSLRAYRVS